jgi:hypothetical protein
MEQGFMLMDVESTVLVSSNRGKSKDVEIAAVYWEARIQNGCGVNRLMVDLCQS